MPEKFEPKYDQKKDLEKFIKEQIETARKEAIPKEEHRIHGQRMDQLDADFLEKRITQEELIKRMGEEAKKQKIAGIVKLSNIGEFILALKILGGSKEARESTLSHENDHMLKAQELGVGLHYELQFLRDEDDELMIEPSIRIHFSEKTSDDERRKILKEIVLAPLGYLSDGDKRKLGIKEEKVS